MIYDCFIFNNEIDILKLRLEYLYDHVDHFVLVESNRTLSGLEKPLTFNINRDQFTKYEDKIIYVQAPERADLKTWDYEYFQRNYIMEGLKGCNNDDIIFISDVDEIVNIPAILSYKNLKLPSLIEIPMYYYFFNLKADITYKLNIISDYGFLKNKDIGERNNSYHTFIDNYITINDIPKTGWHFSYLFGFNYEKYQDKIRSFSHQEHNTERNTDPKNIHTNIILGRDLFGRTYLHYQFMPKEEIRELWAYIKKLNLEKYYFRITPKIFLQISYLKLHSKFTMALFHLKKLIK